MRIVTLADAHGNLLVLKAVCTGRAVQVGGVLVVNPVSIEMPACIDRSPVPHAIETGGPHARCAVATRGQGGLWSADLRAGSYDWDGAAQQARANGSSIVAHWTATGRV